MPLGELVAAAGFAVRDREILCRPEDEPPAQRLAREMRAYADRLVELMRAGPSADLADVLRTPIGSEMIWAPAGKEPDDAEAAAAALPPDLADLLRAAAALGRGDADRAEALLEGLHARGACPPRGLELLAQLAAERNAFRHAVALLDEADADDTRFRRILASVRTRPDDAAGHNDPCPCGSGRKYKRCCASAAVVPLPDRFRVLFSKLVNFSQQPVHRTRTYEMAEAMGDPGKVFGDVVCFDAVLFTDLPDGDEPFIDRFLHERGHRLPADERALLEAWRGSELGFVEAVSHDTVRPIGGDRTVRVREELRPREVLLARIVPNGEGHQLLWALSVPRMARARLCAALRDGHLALGRAFDLIDDVRPTTTDGQELVLCRRVYTAGSSLAEALDRELRREDDRTWLLHNSGGYVTATVTLQRGTVEIETCALERLAAIEVLLAGHLGEVVDEEFAEVPDPADGLPLAPAPEPETASRLRTRARARELEWIQTPIPTLGGLTPRQAAADPDMRIELDETLRDLEVFKWSAGGFDTDHVRDLLGLAPVSQAV